MTARSPLLLLLVALFVTALSLHPERETFAQTGSADTLPAPQLSATPEGTNAIELRWNAISGAVRYELHVWWNGLSSWQRIDDGSQTDLSFKQEGLTTGRTYFFIVAGVDSNGDRGDWSKEVSAVLPASATHTATPTATSTATPTSAALSAPSMHAQPGPGLVTLTWQTAANAVSYELIFYDRAISDWRRIGGVLTGTSFIHDGLTAGTTYHYLIRLVDANGATSAWSEYAVATVTESSLPPDRAAEQAALIALYQATDGPNWPRNHNWLTNQPLSTWDGVTTDANGHVIGLNLGSNRMQGAIPDLSALTKLTSLNLAINQLSGPIPDLGALTNLTNLNLELNQLSGPIPDLSALTNLNSLDLDSNQLSGPIPDLSAISNLRELHLCCNQLNGSIPDLNALINLRQLQLYGNRLSGQIPDLGALANLEVLHLGDNQLSGQIPALNALQDLRELYLWGNQLTGSIPELSALTNLTLLILNNNQLSGPIPDLSALKELVQLYLNNNRLTGPIPDLRGHTKLASMGLSDNQLCLPAGLSLSHPNTAVASSLQSLNLASCPDSVTQAPTPTPTAGPTQTPTPTPTAGPTPTPTPTPTSTAASLSAPALRATANPGQITLTWDPVANAESYQLVVWDRAINDWRRIGGVLTSRSYTHLGLTAGTTYYFHVCAVAAGGAKGAWSQQVSAVVPATASGTPTPTPTPTSTPTQSSIALATATPTPTSSALSAPVLTANAGAGQITLTWEAVTNAVSYRLIIWDAALFNWRDIGGVLTGTSYTHRGLAAGAKYYFLIRAVDAGGASSTWSQQASATVTQSATTPQPSAERAALVALYQATDGPNWTNNHNWLTSQPVSTWYGVSADANGHVTSLSLDRNRLRGQLPNLNALVKLEVLNLSYNMLTGTIPDLNPLTNLKILNLSFNDLNGPMSNLSALSNLRILALGYNDFSGQIPDLSALTSLTTLSLDNNQFGAQFPDLSALTNLTSLSVSFNQFSGPFPDLSALTNLTLLNLGANQFPGPFPDLSALTNLSWLALNNSQLTGPFPDLSALTKLRWLYLYGNQLTGPIPDLSALANLTTLHLSNNQFTGPFPDLSALANLTELYLGINNLTGPVPDLSALTKLTLLDLAGTQLCLPDGTSLSHPNSAVMSYLQRLSLPSCTPAGPEQRAALVAIYNATDGANWARNDNWLSDEPIGTWHGVFTNQYGHVIRLSLGHNKMSGPLPDLSALTNLTTAFLAGNQLSGSVPNLSALTRLVDLVLESNQLSGSIPDLSANTRLLRLSLSHNELTGPFPDLSALTNLESLSLGGNELTGPFPDLSALTNLVSVHLGPNRSTGSFPDLSALTNLRELYLSSSQLTGSFPDLSAHTNLAALYLSDNQLSGEIPDLSAFANLRTLFLNDNLLSGEIPDLSGLTNLQRLHLNDNQLTGEIPDLSALTNLAELNLEDNQLTGGIPDLSALKNLTWLDLSNNQLTEQFPDVSLLAKLIWLLLNDNDLTGPILDLNHLANLRWLNLENNDLTGPVPDLSRLTNLTGLNLNGNRLCLPAGAGLSHPNSAVSNHLNSLNLPTCTSTDTMLAPAVPQNLTLTVNGGQVTLTWDAAANAATYELRVWNSLDRQWGSIGGVLTTRSYTHSVLTDGRNYYYQVRARNANGVRGAWSDRVYAAIVTPQFPPPPSSLGLDIFYQKYLDVDGVVVIAPTEVSDEKMVQAREVISGMFSTRPDLLAAMAADSARVAIYKYSEENGGISQLPELRFLSDAALGYVHNSPSLFVAGMPADDLHCGTFIHEVGHMAHYVIEELPGGAEIDARMQALYQVALNEGRWTDLYASTNYSEYWAEMVRFWFWESMPLSLRTTYATLEDYDPEAAKLVKEVFDGATVPAECKP